MKGSTISSRVLPAVHAAVCVVPLLAQGSGALGEPFVVLSGGTVCTEPNAARIEGGAVVIRGSLIESVGAGAEAPPGARVVDCTGRYVFAGFWNCHVHFFTPEWLGADQKPAQELAGSLRAMLLRYGFTTVIDAGSFLENTKALRARIEAGEIRGPRILTCGEPLYPENGTPLMLREQMGIRLPEIASPEQADPAVARNLEGGADAIKIMLVAYTMPPPMPHMPLAVVRAIVDSGHARGKLVLAHPHTSSGLRNAIESGVDILMHPVSNPDDQVAELLEQARARGMALVPTLMLYRFEARREGQTPERMARWIPRCAEQVRDFARAGGQVLFGTDVGYVSDFDPTEEYLMLGEAELSASQVLAALTTAPARRFGFAHRLGRLASGMEADIVVLGSDPFADYAAFADVRLSIRGGKVVYEAEPQR